MRFRFVVLPTRARHGPWREAYAEAVEDAISAKLAWRDEHYPERVFWHPLAAVEEESD